MMILVLYVWSVYLMVQYICTDKWSTEFGELK